MILSFYRRNVPQRPDILPIHVLTSERRADQSSNEKPKGNPDSLRKGMFGKFNGFTLSPLNEQPEEQTPTPVESPKHNIPLQNSRVAFLTSAFDKKNVDSRPMAATNKSSINSASSMFGDNKVAVVAPSRPVISSPVLNHSTNRKNAGTPVRPVRPAPQVPKERKTESPTSQPLLETVKVDSRVEVTVTSVNPSPRIEKKQRPVSSPTSFFVKLPKEEESKSGERESKIFNNPFFQRFFRSDPKQENEKCLKNEGEGTLKKNIKKIDRQSLRNLDISSPITQDVNLSVKVIPVRAAPEPPRDTIDGNVNRVRFSSNICESEDENPRSSVERTNSMRISNVTTKPKIPKFGSMRKSQRPVSMPSARPKSPPPNPPAPPVSTIPRKDNYFIKESSPEYLYDDCLSKKDLMNSEDAENFYENIDEKSGESRFTDEDNSSASSNDGLLSEIVSELSRKDNVYATSMKKTGCNSPEALEGKIALSGGKANPWKATKEEEPPSKSFGCAISSPSSKSPNAVKSSSVATSSSITPNKFCISSPSSSALKYSTVNKPLFKTAEPVVTQNSSLISANPKSSFSAAANRIRANSPSTVTSLLNNYSGTKTLAALSTSPSLTGNVNSSQLQNDRNPTLSFNGNSPVVSSSGSPSTISLKTPVWPKLASMPSSGSVSTSLPSVMRSSTPSATDAISSLSNSGAPFSYLSSNLKLTTPLAKPIATITPNAAYSTSVFTSRPNLQATPSKLTTSVSVISTPASLAASLVKIPPPLPSVGPVAEVVTGVGSIKVEKPDYTSQVESKPVTNTTVTFSVSAPVVASRKEGIGLSKVQPNSDKANKISNRPSQGRVTSPLRITTKGTTLNVSRPLTTNAGKTTTKTVASKSSGASKPASGIKKPGSNVQSKIDTGLRKNL
ncbi:mucin-2-like [Artemia franciscana]|uniref:Uncharacterized protein n=1 Tax=Artemia franciscana TaxID=6661 RepID=A0AA88KZM6_ARTSF|nr:hypothetical protein QYM36_019222 [Artemia franciscana]